MDENLNVEVVETPGEEITTQNSNDVEVNLTAGQALGYAAVGMAGTALLGCIVTDIYWTAKKHVANGIKNLKTKVEAEIKTKKERKQKKQEVDEAIAEESKSEN